MLNSSRAAILLLTGWAALTFAADKFQPQPVKLSEAEINLEKEVNATSSSISRLQIAKTYLEKYFDDVPLGRFASDVIEQNSERQADAISYLKDFSETHRRDLGPQYYYAHIADDTLIWDEKARWALAKDSTSFWSWLMSATAEWRRSKPNLELVANRLERAVILDPSRPEGYLFLGNAYAENGKWLDAIEAYQAGLVCEPANDYLKLRLEDAQDRLKKGNENPKTDD